MDIKKNVRGIGKLETIYSNPNLMFRGAPLGDRQTGDNARAFNQTAPYIAKNRSSENSWTGSSNNDWNNPNNWSLRAVPRNIDDVVIPAGIANYPTIARGAARARNLYIKNGAKLQMNGGELNIRGHLRAEGTFAADGGSINIYNKTDKGLTLSLSNSSYLNNLKIGTANARSWVQLKSRLVVRGDLILEPSSILDNFGHSITVEGNWTDKSGGGFNYGFQSVKIGGTATQNNTSYNLTVPSIPQGYYASQAAGWQAISEKGNFGPKWMFGGSNGEAYLNTQSYIRDRQEYMDNIDAWAITESVPLSAGVTYELEFDYKQEQGMAHQVSVHLGSSILPSKMRQTGTTESIKVDNQWNTYKKQIEVAQSGTYNIGLRSYNRTENGGVSVAYFRNMKLKTISNIPDRFGNANIDIAIAEPPPTTDPPTPPAPPNKKNKKQPSNDQLTIVTDDVRPKGPTDESEPKPSTPSVSYPLEVASGVVFNIIATDGVYDVGNDRLETSAYTPLNDDGPYLAGNRYPIFMLTSEDNQSLLSWNSSDPFWETEVKKAYAKEITPLLGPNSFKVGDSFKLFYEPGTLTWKVYRGNNPVAKFSCPFNATGHEAEEESAPVALDPVFAAKEFNVGDKVCINGETDGEITNKTSDGRIAVGYRYNNGFKISWHHGNELSMGSCNPGMNPNSENVSKPEDSSNEENNSSDEESTKSESSTWQKGDWVCINGEKDGRISKVDDYFGFEVGYKTSNGYGSSWYKDDKLTFGPCEPYSAGKFKVGDKVCIKQSQNGEILELISNSTIVVRWQPFGETSESWFSEQDLTSGSCNPNGN